MYIDDLDIIEYNDMKVIYIFGVRLYLNDKNPTHKLIPITEKPELIKLYVHANMVNEVFYLMGEMIDLIICDNNIQINYEKLINHIYQHSIYKKMNKNSNYDEFRKYIDIYNIYLNIQLYNFVK